MSALTEAVTLLMVVAGSDHDDAAKIITQVERDAVKPWRERLELVHKRVCGYTYNDANGSRCDCGYLQLMASAS